MWNGLTDFGQPLSFGVLLLRIAVAVVIGMCSAVAAYYAMWAVGLAIFVLAVYYTVRQL